MASGFELNLTIGAVVTGALAGLTSVNRSIRQLGETQNRLADRQRLLGNVLENPLRMSGRRVRELRDEYARLGSDIERLSKRQQRLHNVEAARRGVIARRQQLKSEVVGTVATVGSMLVPVKLAVDYESAMADVRKVVDFDSEGQFKAFGEEILSLTRILPKTGTELAQIAASGGQLGVAREDLGDFVTTVAKMSVAFDMTAEAAGDSMAKLANVYKIPIAEIGNLGDAINELSNSSPAKAADIVETLGRVGGVAKQFGLTETQAASLSNTMIALGKSPEVAATSINSMLVKLMTADKGGKEFQQTLAALQLDANQLAKDIKQNPEAALLGFIKRLNTLPEEDRMGALVELFGREYADDIAVLAGNVDQYEKSIRTLNSTAADGKKSYLGSMNKEFAARAATTANNWQLLKNNMVELGITIGSVLLPAINNTIDGIKPWIQATTEWAQANPELIGGIMKVIGALVAFKVGSFVVRFFSNEVIGFFLIFRRGFNLFSTQWLRAIMRFRWGGGVLGGLVSKLGGVFKWLGGVFPIIGRGLLWLGRLFLTTPIGMVLGLLGTAAYLLYTRWDEVCSGARLIWQQLGDFFGGLWNEITTAFDGGILGVSQLIINWSPLGLFYQAFADVLGWFDITLPEDFTGFIGAIWTSITDAIATWDPLKWIEKAFAKVIEWFGALGNTIKSEIASWFGESENVMNTLAPDDPFFNKPTYAEKLARAPQTQEYDARRATILKNRGISEVDYLQLSPDEKVAIEQEVRNPAKPQQQPMMNLSELQQALSMQRQQLQKKDEKQKPEQNFNVTYAPNITVPAESQGQIQQIVDMSFAKFQTQFKRLQQETARREYA